MRHPVLTIYLAAVMLMVKQPRNFWLIFIGVIWAFRSSDWVRRWKLGPPLQDSPLLIRQPQHGTALRDRTGADETGKYGRENESRVLHLEFPYRSLNLDGGPSPGIRARPLRLLFCWCASSAFVAGNILICNA
jgi:hypothetical protein